MIRAFTHEHGPVLLRQHRAGDKRIDSTPNNYRVEFFGHVPAPSGAAAADKTCKRVNV